MKISIGRAFCYLMPQLRILSNQWCCYLADDSSIIGTHFHSFSQKYSPVVFQGLPVGNLFHLTVYETFLLATY